MTKSLLFPQSIAGTAALWRLNASRSIFSSVADDAGHDATKVGRLSAPQGNTAFPARACVSATSKFTEASDREAGVEPASFAFWAGVAGTMPTGGFLGGSTTAGAGAITAGGATASTEARRGEDGGEEGGEDGMTPFTPSSILFWNSL